jgi:hypothetical protein
MSDHPVVSHSVSPDDPIALTIAPALVVVVSVAASWNGFGETRP